MKSNKYNGLIFGTPGRGSKYYCFKKADFKLDLAPHYAMVKYEIIDSEEYIRMWDYYNNIDHYYDDTLAEMVNDGWKMVCDAGIQEFLNL